MGIGALSLPDGFGQVFRLGWQRAFRSRKHRKDQVAPKVETTCDSSQGFHGAKLSHRPSTTPGRISQKSSTPKSHPPPKSTASRGRLVFYCRTTGASTAPRTSRRMCCPTHCACYCAPCQPLLQAFSGWIRSPPPTTTPKSQLLQKCTGNCGGLDGGCLDREKVRDRE